MIEDPNVKLLIEVMDLKIPIPASLEINRYEFIEGTGIVINQIKVLDSDGNYIKFAKLKDVTKYLSKYPIKFKPKDV